MNYVSSRVNESLHLLQAGHCKVIPASSENIWPNVVCVQDLRAPFADTAASNNGRRRHWRHHLLKTASSLNAQTMTSFRGIIILPRLVEKTPYDRITHQPWRRGTDFNPDTSCTSRSAALIDEQYDACTSGNASDIWKDFGTTKSEGWYVFANRVYDIHWRTQHECTHQNEIAENYKGTQKAVNFLPISFKRWQYQTHIQVCLQSAPFPQQPVLSDSSLGSSSSILSFAIVSSQ